MNSPRIANQCSNSGSRGGWFARGQRTLREKNHVLARRATFGPVGDTDYSPGLAPPPFGTFGLAFAFGVCVIYCANLLGLQEIERARSTLANCSSVLDAPGYTPNPRSWHYRDLAVLTTRRRGSRTGARSGGLGTRSIPPVDRASSGSTSMRTQSRWAPFHSATVA